MIAMSRFLLILLMLGSPNAFAGISKWVDAQGQVHYSDQPPPPAALARTLRTTSEAADSAGSGVNAVKTIAEREAEIKRDALSKQDAADKAAKTQAAEDAFRINCDNARKNLRTLQSGVRMAEIGADGERYFIDDTQHQQRIGQARLDIGTYCK